MRHQIPAGDSAPDQTKPFFDRLWTGLGQLDAAANKLGHMDLLSATTMLRFEVKATRNDAFTDHEAARLRDFTIPAGIRLALKGAHRASQ